MGGGVDAVERAQRADDDLARDDGAEQADADLPVEAERADDRLDEAAEVADDAVGQVGELCGARCKVDGQNAEHPDQEGDAEDDGAGLLEEELAAVVEAQRERAHGGPAILRQLQDEGRGRGLHHGGVEQLGGEQRGEEAERVEAEHDDGAQPDDAAERTGGWG